MGAYPHQPVLLAEAVTSLGIRGDGTYLDATFGRGGHSRAILARLTEQGRLFALDKDPQAVEAGRRALGDDPRFAITQGSYADMGRWTRAWGVAGELDGILFDLGVSSPQLDDPERGFSFMEDGPLDMRMDPTQGISAAEFLASADERELSRVFWEFGEERHARRIARSIVKARRHEPLERTSQLAGLIEKAIGRREGKHPATRCFQAIRIHINNELADLSSGLQAAIEQLRPGGRLVAISFHSLEDRLVKRTIREAVRPGQVRRGLPEPPDWRPRLRSVGKAIRPSDAEISANPRARSAVMRVAERLA
ncbi:MAG: 16S rRNA (cytosine(1402)-N(4))-methyltransferase RsmH [Xanthomonadales bacterium]|nr:16S rRNA (cytosine(1402)-N(4))-methyltransferase RsmH [Xanthomonadales bacterium]NIN59748.1 16S rRNA (cytosine(1402)-N(4))-methyltransferase RsmH [Xanthomonadales bacterium]NIN75517.1 16S rRNA (cytosine(1402)-N(4))-methyltransferase RsmH [Xanthomonadales bacterium]NIO15206.1 16S rRNA (cytosine(1402)-N(4))-methyltransferase RsmH [Xanthomonadales bacterium]NIP12141.1 16S rRNA (cytosine(1402)-N(4))-methyltransferase RsmH [Xanthomonadales bacterium]